MLALRRSSRWCPDMCRLREQSNTDSSLVVDVTIMVIVIVDQDDLQGVVLHTNFISHLCIDRRHEGKACQVGICSTINHSARAWTRSLDNFDMAPDEIAAGAADCTNGGLEVIDDGDIRFREYIFT